MVLLSWVGWFFWTTALINNFIQLWRARGKFSWYSVLDASMWIFPMQVAWFWGPWAGLIIGGLCSLASPLILVVVMVHQLRKGIMTEEDHRSG